MHLLIGLMIFCILLILFWIIAEFKFKKSWTRILFGALAFIAWLVFLNIAIPVFHVLEKFNYNANYGFASKQLIDTTIEKIESGETEKVLKSLKKLQEKFKPTYENRANYDKLVNEAVEEMKTDKTNKEN
jgi:glucan phosphoethanolaminetransferase (alkaline phosphatase superfamily)